MTMHVHVSYSSRDTALNDQLHTNNRHALQTHVRPSLTSSHGAMIASTRSWLRRNRTNLAIGAGVIGAGYLAGQYVVGKIQEARQRMSEDRIAKEKYARVT